MLFLHCSQNVGKFFLLKSECNVPKHVNRFGGGGEEYWQSCLHFANNLYVPEEYEEPKKSAFLPVILLYTTLVLKV